MFENDVFFRLVTSVGQKSPHEEENLRPSPCSDAQALSHRDSDQYCETIFLSFPEKQQVLIQRPLTI